MRYVKPDDWIIPADLDEFIQFPTSLTELISEMEQAEATFIMGKFTDRITSGGTLASLNEHTSIWNQYPFEACVSERLARCWCQKVTLCRGHCRLASGHHNVIFPAKPLITRKCKIHHFKWRSGLVEALRQRIAIYNETGTLSKDESQRILNYIAAHGRIIPEEFDSRPGWNPEVKEDICRNVVFTSITNGYDELVDPPQEAQHNVEYTAFLDEPHASEVWRIRPAHNGYDDFCRNAKIHKIIPHRYFPEAEYSAWIDGSIIIKPGFSVSELMENCLLNHDIAVFRHPDRSSIYSEYQSCVEKDKDDAAIMRHQMARYKYEEYPGRNGLAECAIILRRHSQQVREFNEVWWEEICNHSKRDQLSFNYVAWKMRTSIAYLRGSIRNNPWFERRPHFWENKLSRVKS